MAHHYPGADGKGITSNLSVSRFFSRGEKKVTKSDQIFGKQKTRLCKEFVMKIRRPKADPGGLGD